MKEKFFDDFLQKIAPYRDLWQSVHFVGYAGLIKGTWVLLGGRAVLSTKSIEDGALKKLVNFPDFFAFMYEFPISELDLMLRMTVQTEKLNMSLGGNTFQEIELRAGKNSTLTWFNPAKFDRSWKYPLGVEGVGFQWTTLNSLQTAQVGGVELLQRTSELLRLHTDLDGVEALANQYTPGLPLSHDQCPQLQIVAPLPFELKYKHGMGVYFEIPETADPSQILLKVFFGPAAPAVARPISLEECPTADGPFTVTWNFDWPRNAHSAEIGLFYRDREVDKLPVNKWAASATVRGAIDEYFDAEHKQLRKGLQWQQEARSELFELAVVRLLNLLGIPATWYGKTADPDRPDASAVVADESSKNTVLLIECTREKPTVKFSALAERVRKLNTLIGQDADVFPIVFTATSVVDTEAAAASEHGICLIGADELTHLLGLLASPGATPDRVLQYLRQRTAVAGAQRLTGRW